MHCSRTRLTTARNDLASSGRASLSGGELQNFWQRRRITKQLTTRAIMQSTSILPVIPKHSDKTELDVGRQEISNGEAGVWAVNIDAPAAALLRPASDGKRKEVRLRSQLEIWAPDFLDKNEFELGAAGQRGPKGVVKDTARFNRLAWGGSRGVIAAGLENGELALWDPAKILAGARRVRFALILRNSIHTGPIRGLDFNPIQTSLPASGAVSGEVSFGLELTGEAIHANPRQVQYVLAGASSTGNTVVWDLRGKREVVALAYGAGGAGGMSDIKWHPDNATRLVTSHEDNQSPMIMLWDLRNARAPEKILTGHEKGILSLSWCAQDADLLSCGKDNRTLCWNPQTGDALDLLAAAFFDGTIGIHSLQGTNESAADSATQVAAHAASGADIFDLQPGGTATSAAGTLSLSQPPKWFRRSVSASFGFGGKLVSVANLPGASGKHQSGSVHLRTVHVEQDIDVVDRVQGLREALDKDKARPSRTGHTNNSREELITLLGFEKAEVERKVREAVDSLALTTI
ncbi:Nucleoporin-interacting protein [Mycena indigotica]|uniref:Protein transport protein SEC31 n=1 Tax=Mycena indigotica TaxID=2126181 RepID=A0A8H6VXB5_9AGAR|nr:Nucleoporin-interacting protein [Mycena indigotica]KAF7293598.1 Nucleoporin-interacting protein [Mycena indigotica]